MVSRILIIGLLITLLSSCAGFLSPVSTQSPLVPEKGYVLTNTSYTHAEGKSRYVRIGLNIESLETKTLHLIEFYPSKQYQLVELPLGRYKVVSISFMDTQKQGNKKIPPINFDLKSQQIRYLGDYHVDLFESIPLFGTESTPILQWKVGERKDQFEDARTWVRTELSNAKAFSILKTFN